MSVLEIFDIINHVGGGVRTFEEGSRILNSNHILMCGLNNAASEKVNKYFALCLSSSSPHSYPHEINVEITDNSNKKVKDAHCSCQAGNSGQCKHVVGVLLYLNKKTKDSIEELGCTDLRQQWGQIKKKVSEAYECDEFNTFCHGTQVDITYTKSPELRRELFNRLCEAEIESELSQSSRLHRSNIQSSVMKEKDSKNILKCLNNNLSANSSRPVPVICDLNKIYGFNKNISEEEHVQLNRILNHNIWQTYLENFIMKIDTREEAIYFNKYVKVNYEQAKNIFISTVQQNDNVWFNERKKRITGSICYSLYTYMKKGHSEDEWRKKLFTLYKSSFKGNQHTLRGKEFESKARKAYEKLSNNKVKQLGLLILHTSSWFGYSADGIVDINILVELKCPKNDKNNDADALCHSLPYIQIKDNTFTLKTNHPYYGQVQLGMALYGLQECHFVVYENIHDTCAIILVPRNDQFLKSFIPTLSECYFTRILPWLISNSKENNKEV